MNPKTVAILARRELRGMFDHPTGYILLVAFLAVSDFLFFRQAYMLRAATLRPMFDLLPWMYLFFVPAVTMRAVAEETRQGTLEVLLAQPITELELLLGKYLGQVLFVWIALALTLPIPLGLSLGADLQVGVIVAQYAGGALLGAGLAGVGLWASSLSPNQITAFIVAAGVTFVLILVGLDPLLVGLPPLLGTIAAQLGVLSHFANIARGVIDLRDAIYFATLAAIFLSLAYLVLMRRKLARKGETWSRLRLGVSLIVATLVVVNLFGQHIGGRLDLTPGKAYSLARATKQLLGNLPDLLTIKLFASKELPPEIALLQRDLRDMLGDYRAAGKGKVRLATLDPSSDSTALQEARNLGIPSVQFNVMGQSELRVKEGYLGIAVQYAGQSKTIPFVQRTEDLEYRLSSLIRSLTVTARPKLGLATFGTNPTVGRTFDALREQLEENYDVRTLSFSTDSEPPSDLPLVAVAGMPFSLSDAQVERFKKYLAQGGNALIMASGMEIPDRSFFATPRDVPWNKVLEPYGVSIRSDMVYDLASNERVAVPVQFGRLLLAYPFWVRALSTQASVINEEIDGVFLPWTSSLDTSKARPGTVTPLLLSSRAAGVETSEVFLEPRQQFKTDSLAPRVLAVMVNPLAADGEENSGDSSERPRGRVVVIGNSDIVADRNVRNAPENLTFVLNAIDWLAQDEALIAIRAKSRTPPPLVFESPFIRESVKYANVAGVPILLALAGAAQWLRRKRLQSRPYRPFSAAAKGGSA